jgi:TIR domain
MRQPIIYLSYAHEDRAVARNIYQTLRRSDFDIWFDEVELRVGQRSQPVFERAISNANIMLLLVGEPDSRGFQQRSGDLSGSIFGMYRNGRSN